MQHIEMKNRPVQHDIDQTLETWYSTILKATNENIPKTNTKTEQKPIHNNTIKNIQWFLKNLREEGVRQGWSRSKFRTFKILKSKLVEECTQKQ